MSYEWDAFAQWLVGLLFLLSAVWSAHRSRLSAGTLFLLLGIAYIRGGIANWSKSGHDVPGWDWVTNPTVIFWNTVAIGVTLATTLAESYLWVHGFPLRGDRLGDRRDDYD